MQFLSLFSSDTRGALKNTQWLLLEKAISMPLLLVINILVTRYLGVSLSGEYNYILSFLAIATPLSAAGLGGIVTKGIVENPDQEAVILGTAIVGRLMACVLVLLVFSGLALYFISDKSHWLILLVAANFFSSFYVLNFWFQAKVDSKIAVVARLSVLVLVSAAKLYTVLWQQGLQMLFIVHAVEFVLTATAYSVCYFYRQRNFIFKYDFSLLRSLFDRSKWLLLSRFAAVIYLKIDQIMLANIAGVASVGIYAAASRLSEIWFFIPEAIVASFFPSLLKAKHKNVGQYTRRLQNLCDGLLWFAVVIALVVFMAAPYVINLLYGAPFIKSAAVLQIHIFSGLFIFMRALASRWFIAEDLLKFSLVTHAVGAILNIGLNLWLIPRYQEVGAAWATFISYAGASYFALFWSKQTRPMAMIMTKSLVLPLRLFIMLRKT